MQEHFNEEYMESDKYPKTDFSGIITNLAEINFSKDGEYKAKVSGKLQIHGISHEVSEPGVIIVKGDKITLKSEFNIKLADYKVLIGSMVADKINKAATIKLTSELTQK
jgi:polyisoprenoid-binding protein YceI